MNDQSLKGSPFEFALGVWERRKWLALALFVTSSTAALTFVKFLPNLYKATTTVLVERHQLAENLARPAVAGEVETRLRSINERVLSRGRLKELIQLFGLYPDLRKRHRIEEVVDHMRRDILLEVKSAESDFGRRTTIAFALTYRGRDPQTVAQVTNTLASFYIEENWKARGRQATETAQFFKIQLDELKKRLQEQEGRVLEAKKLHSDSPERARASMMALEQLYMQLRLNMERLDRVVERREKLVKELGESLPQIPGGELGGRAERIRKLKQELQELRTSFTDQYPEIIRLKAEIAALDRGVTETGAEGTAEMNMETDPSVQRLKAALGDVETEIKLLESEEKRVQAAIAAYQRKVEAMPEGAERVSDALREYETIKELYSSLLKRYAEAQQAEDWETRQKGESFRVLDSALPPTQPMAPNRLRLMLMGLVLSLGLAAGAVVLVEQLDASFHSMDELKAFTRVPVLISIPPIVTQSDIKRGRQHLCLAAAGAMVGLILIVGASYYMGHENEGIVRMLMRGGS